MAKKLYRLPEAKYDPTFIKALAMAIHLNLLEPGELEYWQDEGFSQAKMAKELYDRIVANSPNYKRESEEYEE